MKVGIDCYFMSDEKSAYGKAQFNILKWLTFIDSVDEFYIFTDKKRVNFLTNNPNCKIVNIERNGSDFISRTRSIKKAIKDRNIDLDVFIETTEIMPKLNKKIRKYTIQHDFSNGTLEPKFSLAHLKGKIYRVYQKSSIIKSNVIFCNSEFTRNQLYALFPLKKNVLLAPHSCDAIYEDGPGNFSSEEFAYLNLPEKFFFFVGRITVRHKNTPLLLKAYLEFSRIHKDICLVIASTEDPTKTEYELIEMIGNRLILLQGLSTKEIAYIYSRATAFIFPSSYEGFGVPILEAQHMSCPLLLNEIPVFREVSGGCGIFFNGTVASLLEAMEKALEAETRFEIIDCGKRNCKKYSWKKVALTIYQELSKEGNHA